MSGTLGEMLAKCAMAIAVLSLGAKFAPRIGTGIRPRAVRVLAGRFRVVNVDIDTGIR